MAITTAWLVGSYYLPATTITINGNGYDFSTGSQGWYLYSTDADLSLITRLEAILDGLGLTGTVRVLENRKVKISAAGVFSITWTSATMRDLFGFTGNLAGASSYTAPNISPLLWSPGKPESPTESPLGVTGRKVRDTKFSTAPDGTQVADSHYSQRINTFTWSHVAMDRFQTANEVGGEYVVWFDYVFAKANKWYLWRNIAEDVDGTDPVTWTSALGPYGSRPTRGLISADFQRSPGFERVDRRAQVSLDCLIVPEWEVP